MQRQTDLLQCPAWAPSQTHAKGAELLRKQPKQVIFPKSHSQVLRGAAKERACDNFLESTRASRKVTEKLEEKEQLPFQNCVHAGFLLRTRGWSTSALRIFRPEKLCQQLKINDAPQNPNLLISSISYYHGHQYEKNDRYFKSQQSMMIGLLFITFVN